MGQRGAALAGGDAGSSRALDFPPLSSLGMPVASFPWRPPKMLTFSNLRNLGFLPVSLGGWQLKWGILGQFGIKLQVAGGVCVCVCLCKEPEQGTPTHASFGVACFGLAPKAEHWRGSEGEERGAGEEGWAGVLTARLCGSSGKASSGSS